MINVIGLGPGNTDYITKLGETNSKFRCSNRLEKKFRIYCRF